MLNLPFDILISEDETLIAAVSGAVGSRGRTINLWSFAEGNTQETQFKNESFVGSLICDLSSVRELGPIRKFFPMAGILLTAPSSYPVGQLAAGLASGGDDFIQFPFSGDEFLARLDALAIRKRSRGQSLLKCGSLSLDVTNRRVRYSDKPVALTPTEFRILEILMRHLGAVVTRRMLCESLWEPDWEGVTNVIEVHMNRLRTKLNNAGSPKLIHTVRGSGYRLIAADSGGAIDGSRHINRQSLHAQH